MSSLLVPCYCKWKPKFTSFILDSSSIRSKQFFLEVKCCKCLFLFGPVLLREGTFQKILFRGLVNVILYSFQVFLQHLNVLLSLSTFTALWLTILDFMDKYMHSDESDLLVSAFVEGKGRQADRQTDRQ